MKKPEDRTKEQLINSQRMGIRTVAEGVETEEQLAFLRAVECDEAQGYLFSRPVNAADFQDLVMHA